MEKISKEKRTKEKGITLVALVITIIVLLILAGITIGTLFGKNGIIENAKKAKDETERVEKEEQEAIKDIQDSLENKEDLTGFDEEKGVNRPEVSNDGNDNAGLIPIKWNGVNWEVCSENDPTWYNYSDKKIKVKNKEGKEEEVEAFTWANAMLSDGKYSVGEVEEGTEITDINDLGSMFVWIPRYAYSINEYKVEKNLEDGTTQNITKVEFLKGTTNEGTSGNTYLLDYNADNVKTGETTPMIVHPAFDFGGIELKGIWVAKFEASMEEENLNTEENNNVTDKTIKVLPNKETWRYIQIGNAFKVCLNMKEDTKYKLSKTSDTHLLKNSEWGVVSYLAASQYGKVPAKNEREDMITGSGNYKQNLSQSTTGNITGIYDMNGGTWEYVAAYWDNGNNNLEEQGTIEIFQENRLNSKYLKYFDKYEVGELESSQGESIWNLKNTEGNQKLYEMAKERVENMKQIKGDAMYEAINEWSYWGRYANKINEFEAYELAAWLKPTIDENGKILDLGENILYQYARSLYGEDYTLIGTYVNPFITRGGGWMDSTTSGIFSSNGYHGDDFNTGFRVSIIIE